MGRQIVNTLMATGKQMDTNKKMRDYISAFADGELPAADLELVLAALRESDGRETWRLYHEIGDVLRAEPPASDISPGFTERLAARLAAEPTPLRRGAARTALPTDALAKLAPGVVMSAEAAQPATANAASAVNSASAGNGAADVVQQVATLAPLDAPATAASKRSP